MASEPKQTIHILNPMAGKGMAKKLMKTIKDDECAYMSKTPESCAEFMEATCREEPRTCFTVYGGDGTVYRAVNAIMGSGYNSEASLKVVPVGSGNDFVKTFEGKKGQCQIDVMKFNGKYAVNVINMGFDCGVVQRTLKLKKKPLITGKMAYVYGVIGELINKKPLTLSIEMTLESGEVEKYEGEYLLCAVANAQWYGGGFKVAPLADVSDGLLDVVLVKSVSRRTFIGLVGNYKKGTLVDEKGTPIEKARDILVYKKCKEIKIQGCGVFCADGEIFEEDHVEISLLPKALNYIAE